MTRIIWPLAVGTGASNVMIAVYIVVPSGLDVCIRVTVPPTGSFSSQPLCGPVSPFGYQSIGLLLSQCRDAVNPATTGIASGTSASMSARASAPASGDSLPLPGGLSADEHATSHKADMQMIVFPTPV